MTDNPTLDRIAEVLTAHQRHVIHEKRQMCLCGWGELGHRESVGGLPAPAIDQIRRYTARSWDHLRNRYSLWRS